MNFFKGLLSRIDRVVDKKCMPLWHHYKSYMPAIGLGLIAFMIILFVWRTIKNKADVTALMISQDIVVVMNALEKIDKDCDIISFDHQRNYVDFLNVTTFVGSEVGSLNLANPAQWRGPYLQDNPTLQDKPYEIIKAAEGYFLVPGSGVRLPSGLVMGTDVIIVPDTKLMPLIKQGGVLNFRGTALAAPLSFGIGDYKGIGSMREKVQRVNQVLEEFNTAMPYAQGTLDYFRIQLPNKS